MRTDVVLLLACMVAFSTTKRPQNCDNIKRVYQGIPDMDQRIPPAQIYDADLELCKFANHSIQLRPSCCTANTEQGFLVLAAKDYADILSRETEGVKKIIDVENRKFRGYFSKMVELSRSNTQYELGTTFKIPNIVNKRILERLFIDLESLLGHQKFPNMLVTIETVLAELFPAVVIRSLDSTTQRELTSSYSSCLSENWKKITPERFGKNISVFAESLQSAAYAASYLSEALKITDEVLNVTKNVKLSSHCIRDMVKLTHCPKCYGYPQMQPCREFCEEVFQACLQQLVRLEEHWDFHMRIIKILADTLLRLVKIPVVLADLPAALSAALKSALDAFPTYRAQIEGICGRPEYTTLSHSHVDTVKFVQPVDTLTAGSDEDLSALIMTLEKEFRGFFGRLPLSICSSEPLYDTSGAYNCWSGLSEKVGNKKKLLQFVDEFAPYPEKNEEVTNVLAKMKRLTKQVVRLFGESPKQNNAVGTVEQASGANPDNEQVYVDSEFSGQAPLALPGKEAQPYNIGSVVGKSEIPESAEITLDYVVTRSKSTSDQPFSTSTTVVHSDVQGVLSMSMTIVLHSFLVPICLLVTVFTVYV